MTEEWIHLPFTDSIKNLSASSCIYNKVQRHHAVTACRIRSLVIVDAAGGVCLAVPFETVASRHRSHTCRAVVHGQVQGHSAVAARGVGQGEGGGVVAGGVRVAVDPDVGVAGGLFVNAGVTVVDGQVQGHDAVAAIVVAADHRVGWSGHWCFGVGYPVPSERLALDGCRVTVGRVVDGQVQRHNAVAAIVVAADHRVGWSGRWCFGVGHSVPAERLTLDGCRVTYCGLIDGQVQCVHLSATVRILVTVEIVSTDSVRCIMPRKATANGFVNSGVDRVVNG